jgi:hypothetical protein
LRTEGFFYNLDILYGGLGIGKLKFLIKKKLKKIFSCNFFFNFWSLKPWIRIGSGSGSGFGSGSVLASNIKLRIRIRIRKKLIRIHNPGFFSSCCSFSICCYSLGTKIKLHVNHDSLQAALYNSGP